MPPADSPSHPWLRSLARLLVTPDWLGALLVRISGPSSFLTTQRQLVLEQRFNARCARCFSELTVLHGPFAGLRYPTGAAHGSALHPKLLGSYESELHPALIRLQARTYDDIVDIGFAEGYYLIGLAQWFPKARIWGFDLSPEAHRLCTALAVANAVQPERMHLGHEATASALMPALGRRALVICDCEGCEAGLFSTGHMDRWKTSDLIIECHDFVEPGVTVAIANRLAATHQVELVPTTDCRLKIAQLPPKAKSLFSPAELFRLVDEGRPAAQNWIVAEPLR
ncbi:MAG: class I SAM-dependent methyltransferase [Opitutaceae bacterium]|nr:class I SAM-dependent methyltransferase [Opitutaceae bacterium]